MRKTELFTRRTRPGDLPQARAVLGFGESFQHRQCLRHEFDVIVGSHAGYPYSNPAMA